MPQPEAPIVVSLSTSTRVGKGRNVAYWQALLRPREMSDLSPQSGSKRTLIRSGQCHERSSPRKTGPDDAATAHWRFHPQRDLFQLAATYVDRILRGARPRELPVQAPVKYELLIN